MRSDEIRTEALSVYSHANVRDRYDADLMMAGFSDGAEWADAHPLTVPEPQGEPSDVQLDAACAEIAARMNYRVQPTRGTMRAALRAAGGVR